ILGNKHPGFYLRIYGTCICTRKNYKNGKFFILNFGEIWPETLYYI
uniref:Uncharacterized protein n=1 Tax=Amphimedon queenslandica TaxID=400682 RepID=A0A1X7URV3_AMPQE